MPISKQQVIDRLKLIRHPEGGYFRETYRATYKISTTRENQERSICTCIYYLLTDDQPVGHFHKNISDIVHYFHLGSPLRYLLLSPAGELQEVIMGNNLVSGQQLQLLVPGGYWKSSSLVNRQGYALISESVAPGFDYLDMAMATEDEMQKLFADQYPTIKNFIQKEVRSP